MIIFKIQIGFEFKNNIDNSCYIFKLNKYYNNQSFFVQIKSNAIAADTIPIVPIIQEV